MKWTQTPWSVAKHLRRQRHARLASSQSSCFHYTRYARSCACQSQKEAGGVTQASDAFAPEIRLTRLLLLLRLPAAPGCKSPLVYGQNRFRIQHCRSSAELGRYIFPTAYVPAAPRFSQRCFFSKRNTNLRALSTVVFHGRSVQAR